MFENGTMSNNIEYNNLNGGITFLFNGIYKITVGFGRGQSFTSSARGGVRLYGFTRAQTMGTSKLSSDWDVNGDGEGSTGDNFVFFANISDNTDQYLLQFGETSGYSITIYDPSSYSLDGIIFPSILATIEYIGL